MNLIGRRIFRLGATRPFSTSQLTTCEALSLTDVGISTSVPVYRNLSYKDIADHERKYKEGEFAKDGTFDVDTGKFTGRSPKDKFIVNRPPSNWNIWWGEVNQPITEKNFDELHLLVKNFYNKEADKIYVFDGYCGANLATRKKVRIVTNLAWQHHFVKNMFIRPKTSNEVENFEPDYTIINACKISDTNFETHGLNSEVFVAFDVERALGIIGGTWYGGEMKKGIFSMMNFWLPLEGIMPMHCSANIGEKGDSALFFGLSGTGKTTLSADPKRKLIGDDEHGWDKHGVFNFEGGCYAKVIDLSEKSEPDIYHAIKPNALLENVTLDDDKVPDYHDRSKTQNTRVSYPIEHIANYEPTSKGGHPKNIIFLTCDAYGVLPPVAKLSSGQAMYHFLSGYTAKVAGTERGVTEPQATFSACFGAAFMTLHPTKYADLLQLKIERYGAHVFLVNTGWTGGPYGVGSRMAIGDTRKCIDHILDGSINESSFTEDKVFGFQVPDTLGDIKPSILSARDAWADTAAYDAQRVKLAKMFKNNYQAYITPGHTDFSAFGPRI